MRASTIAMSVGAMPSAWALGGRAAGSDVPSNAQVIDMKSFLVLDTVPPPSEANASTQFVWPDTTADSLTERPFHIYDDEFFDVIGDNPTLTLVASTENTDKNPLFHEAVTWYPATKEVFFAQNAGDPAAGTGLNKSAMFQKISIDDAEEVRKSGNKSRQVQVDTVSAKPQIINPNGATNFDGQILVAGEGQGDKTPPTLYLLNPKEPYNTTALVNNYFGRQFNSLNDVAVHPTTGEIYFVDTLYGLLQDFRPKQSLRNQVYRFNHETGALGVVADGFSLPNGVTFAPGGNHAYVTDTGSSAGFYGMKYSEPATIYRYDVKPDGTWDNRVTFAYTASGIPDGIHCDAEGRVYAGCGDGVQVWNTAGKLIGNIYLGTTSANFNFAGKGRMVIMAETEAYYATLAASGAPLT